MTSGGAPRRGTRRRAPRRTAGPDRASDRSGCARTPSSARTRTSRPTLVRSRGALRQGGLLACASIGREVADVAGGELVERLPGVGGDEPVGRHHRTESCRCRTTTSGGRCAAAWLIRRSVRLFFDGDLYDRRSTERARDGPGDRSAGCRVLAAHGRMMHDGPPDVLERPVGQRSVSLTDRWPAYPCRSCRSGMRGRPCRTAATYTRCPRRRCPSRRACSCRPRRCSRR